MSLKFKKYLRNEPLPNHETNLVCLKEDNWDDFGFKTLFTVFVFDEKGHSHNLGSVKIGYEGQSYEYTSELIGQEFSSLESNFFSLGQETEYYENIHNYLSDELKKKLLTGLKDVVFDEKNLLLAQSDKNLNSVFNLSLLRNVTFNVITTQFRRILAGGAPLSEYDFSYEKPENDSYSGIKIRFKVVPGTKPRSNIHVLIGRNGVGKTTVLNNMINALVQDKEIFSKKGYFYQQGLTSPVALASDYFRGVVSVSFSAFDSFFFPPTKANKINYHYIGLKTIKQSACSEDYRLKTIYELCKELVESLKICLSVTGKRKRWVNAVKKLESDAGFSAMNLNSLIEVESKDNTEKRDILEKEAMNVFSKLSSGHAIVLLTITRLIETVEEKTLVLIDEPETHLHPPLLSAFISTLSELLFNRNGVAIIATHSPVVLQETPKSCVSILRRTHLAGIVDKPTIETFGENVGTLTREVFGLEISKSGFYNLLNESVMQNKGYEQILEEYQNQLGFEGQAILRALIANKEM